MPKTTRTTLLASEARFRQAMRDAGITRKGFPLARVVWRCAQVMFMAAPPSAAPFDVADFAYRILKMWAGDVQTDRLREKAAAEKRARSPR